MRRSQCPPIAVDLGARELRFLQLDQAGTSISAAAAHPLPQGNFDIETHLAAASDAVAAMASNPMWFGRRLVVALPAPIVTMTHLKLEQGEDLDTAVQTRLQDVGQDPLVRTIDVSCPTKRTRGVLCIAMPREVVLRYVAMLHQYRYDITGVFAPASTLLRAFRHVNRRDGDADTATMYLDLAGTECTVAIGHGSQLVAARCITTSPLNSSAEKKMAAQPAPTPVAAECFNSDIMTTINRRVDQGSTSLPSVPHATTTHNAPRELCDELRMCVRHYQGLFHEVPVKRLVFTGDGAMADGPCREIARNLGLSAQIGDPLARWDASTTNVAATDWNLQLRPQWTIAAGLAAHDQEADA
ncbi:MAG: hypothetical protein P8I91_09835 [Phycisphaerales bacterium]|nr:hypothetical protein [Phycisphaerales bacterium]